MAALHTTELDGLLPLVARGKVRDIYSVDDETLLFVATDRISAYDVIMKNAIPDKGKILTKLSEFWFQYLSDQTGVRNHLLVPECSDEELFARLPATLSAEKYKQQLLGRSLLVRKHKLVPLEAIVRGYITGSAWKEYKAHGTVHGQKVGAGLEESLEFPTPIFTPSTKAEQGEHDENISVDQAAKLIGKDLCDKLQVLALELYSTAKDYAKGKGIILADTKFEFGLDSDNNLVLVDEVLTPDSSLFWSLAEYKVGKLQDSFDKQYLRDWLTSTGVAGQDGVEMTQEVLENTKEKYVEAYEKITGVKWC